MKHEQRMVIPAQVMSRHVGDETVILDLTSGLYFGLDPVGARVWQMLTEGYQTDAIVRTLLAEYAVPESQVRQDVQTLLDELISRGLLVVAA